MDTTSTEKRGAGRASAKIAVELLHEGLQGTIVETCDISETGVFTLKVPGMDILRPGMILDIKITGLMGQPPRIVAATVRRLDENGIALQFNEPL